MTAIDPPLPTSIEDFDKDDRISYSKLDNKYLAVADDGSEFEYDPATRSWRLEEDDGNDHYDEHVDDMPDLSGANDSRKRKEAPEDAADGNGNGNNSNKKSRPAKKPKAPPQPRQNTAVYVTGLPQDATVEEVYDLFSRKGGVVAEEIDSGRPRIKLYTDDTGDFKGDALVVFFKPQSVEMAIMLLDDTDFRFSEPGKPNGRISVQAADSSYKKTKYGEEGEGGGGGEGEGKVPNGGRGAGDARSSNGEARDRSNRGKGNSDRQKIIKKTQKLDAKLADWSDDEYPAAAAVTSESSRWDKVVILRHMFTLAELEEDPAALLEIKEDIRDECEKLGLITNVVLYDEEPAGVVSVKFRKPEAALACVQLMNGRSFDGRVVEASIATGSERFKKSKDKDDESEED